MDVSSNPSPTNTRKIFPDLDAFDPPEDPIAILGAKGLPEEAIPDVSWMLGAPRPDIIRIARCLYPSTYKTNKEASSIGVKVLRWQGALWVWFVYHQATAPEDVPQIDPLPGIAERGLRYIGQKANEAAARARAAKAQPVKGARLVSTDSGRQPVTKPRKVSSSFAVIKAARKAAKIARRKPN